jgi:hypothetical protein
MKNSKSAARRPHGARSLERTVPLRPGGHLAVFTHRGSVHLEPWNRPELRVVARIEVPTEVDEDMVEAVLDAVEIAVTGDGDRAAVRSIHSEAPVRRSLERRSLFVWCFQRVQVAPHVHYRIQAPRELELEIADHASSLWLSEREGSVEVKTHRGRVDVESLRGRLRVRSHEGDVAVAGVDGSVDVKTARGTVDVRFARLAADSRVNVLKGSATVEVPAGQDFELDTDIGRGGVFRSDDELVVSSLGGGKARGRVGTGGPLLSLAIHQGKLRLVRTAG